MGSDECDREVFKNGIGLMAIDGATDDVEPWVQKVAVASGQRVDWHYSGGVANVLVLGDHAKATEAARSLLPEMTGYMRVLRWFSGGQSLYRAGDPLPGDVLGADASLTVVRNA